MTPALRLPLPTPPLPYISIEWDELLLSEFCQLSALAWNISGNTHR